jgi:hypothetical protein
MSEKDFGVPKERSGEIVLSLTFVVSGIGRTRRNTCEGDFGVSKEHPGKVSREAQVNGLSVIDELLLSL